MKDKAKILDTEYTIQLLHEEDDPKLKECDGYTDLTSKKIIVCNRCSDDKMQVENPEVVIEKVVRHEMIHAFLSESGLGVNSWADNEEIVDWIAIQFPKMQKAFDEVFSEEVESGGVKGERRMTKAELIEVVKHHEEGTGIRMDARGLEIFLFFKGS